MTMNYHFKYFLLLFHLCNTGCCLLDNENRKNTKLVSCTEVDQHRITSDHLSRDRATEKTIHSEMRHCDNIV